MPIRPVSPYYLEPQMERVVRPFVIIDSRPYDPPAPRQPLPGEEDEAFISWGSASRFISPQITQPVTSRTSFGGGGFRVTWPDDKDKNKEKKTLEYTEIERTVTEVRVENPDDEEQYVMVERIESIDFRGPDGATHRFTLNNDAE